MEKTIKTNNILPCIIPTAGIAYALRENMFHQEIQSRRLSLLRPYFTRPIGDLSRIPALPLVINVGGGAWKSSTPWVHTPELTYLANHGYIIASIDYSTINFDIFPAQIEDVKCAIRFLRKNAAKFGADPDRIAIMGDSAGGQLAALAGLTGGSGLFTVGDDLDVSDEVAAVVDIYGPTDFEEILKDSDGLNDIYLEYLGAHNPALVKRNARLASPVNYVRKDAPAFMILHGTADTMVSPKQSRELYDKLTAAGAEAELLWLEGADHADRDFVQTETLEAVLAFLDDHLGKK
ncbi:MAG: alpha/beta hydrolase [Sphaerochaetaceae bacterium]|jgi:acetyl esterase/lipase